MNKKIPSLLFAIGLFTAQTALAQLNINGAQFFIESGAEVTVQGNLTSTVDILGPGKIVLKGTANQDVNMGGFTIPNLVLDNSANVTLTGSARIGSSLLFTNGKILAGNFNLNLADAATVSGMGTGKFIETNGTGQVMKEITANVASTEIPVGAGADYRPAFITTSGTYSTARVGVRVLATPDPNKPPSLTDYIMAYWPITRTGVTGTVTVAGQYIDGDITGTETNLRGYYFNGTDWSSATETHTPASNRVSASIVANGNLSALDKFDLVKAKVFLQGPYNTTTGVMSEALRTYLPNTDPYRVAPYNTTFTHVNNSIAETVIGTPFSDHATDDNIIDWVFLELRNTTVGNPGANIVETRSALIQRDGDIVDVDGVSPVTFNNVPSANYTIAVRHRNHLGVSTDPVTLTPSLGEARSTAPLVDFTTATDAQIFGTSTAFKIATGNKVVLWAGDADVNGRLKYGGAPNDPNRVQTQALTFPGNTSGSYTYNNAIGYFSGDINMDSRVKFAGSLNDVNIIQTN
ncbi:MAG: hypothetical protein ABIN97_00275, partial [Ginsengibacter sp.]